MPASFRVLGCRVDAVGLHEAVTTIAALANGGRPGLVVTLGVEMVMAAQRDAQFRRTVDEAALVTCDTIGLLLASRARHGPLRERVTGVALVDALAARSAEIGDLRLYLLGGQGDTAARAAAALCAVHPGARIAGTRDGYFGVGVDESEAVAAAIRASGANLLLAGLGSPKQELWLARHLAATGCGAGIGIGGSLDVYAGTVRRAPPLFQRTGTEWAYRLVRDPRRWRRQLALPRFALAALGEVLKPGSAGKRRS